MELNGRVALVTGSAGSGMGRSIALTLAREGAKVVVNYRTSKDAAEAIVGQIKGRDGEAIALQADVFEADGCKEPVAATTEGLGPIDICIVNPGAGWHPEPIDKLDSSAAIEDVVSEVAPFFHLMPLVLPQMYKQKWGRVIGVSLLPPCDLPAYSYNAAKAARTQAMLRARDEAWKNGVTINIIAPGPVPRNRKPERSRRAMRPRPGMAKSPQPLATGHRRSSRLLLLRPRQIHNRMRIALPVSLESTIRTKRLKTRHEDTKTLRL